MILHRINCWQVKDCGREPGGHSSYELGACPAATAWRVDGSNHGTNGGRACWAVAGTLCGGKEQGTYAAKLDTCETCDFYARVHREEGFSIDDTRQILRKLGDSPTISYVSRARIRETPT